MDSVGNENYLESGIGKLEQSGNLSRFVPESFRSLPGWVCSALSSILLTSVSLFELLQSGKHEVLGSANLTHR